MLVATGRTSKKHFYTKRDSKGVIRHSYFSSIFKIFKEEKEKERGNFHTHSNLNDAIKSEIIFARLPQK